MRLLLILFLPGIILTALAVVSFLFIMFNFHDNKGDCLSSGICVEGLELITEEGKKIIINKETCLEHKWHWSEEDRTCFIR